MTAASSPLPRRSVVTPMLLALIILPAIFFYTGMASSLALGTCVAAVLLLFTAIQQIINRDFYGRSAGGYKSLTPGTLTLLVVGAIAAHGAVAAMFLPFNELRSIASLLPLTLILMAGCTLGEALLSASDAEIDRAVRRCFILFSILVALAVVHLQPESSYASPKPVFPYTEPSTLALIFTPFVMFRCVRSAGWARILTLFLGFSAALLLENLTLVIGCLLTALICIRGRAVIPVIIGLALCLAILVTQLDMSYYLARLDFSQEEETTTSSLVYIQGWQLIGESLINSGGWGLGFQQLGVHGTNVPAADIIFDQVRDYGNVLDGGFTFSKLVSEFGIFGLMLVCGYFVIVWRSIRKLRKAVRHVYFRANEIFARCVAVSYVIELFVRGAGYFTGTAILFIGSLWLMSAARSSKNLPEIEGASPGLDAA
jgi:hypothetical protein